MVENQQQQYWETLIQPWDWLNKINQLHKHTLKDTEELVHTKLLSSANLTENSFRWWCASFFFPTIKLKVLFRFFFFLFPSSNSVWLIRCSMYVCMLRMYIKKNKVSTRNSKLKNFHFFGAVALFNRLCMVLQLGGPERCQFFFFFLFGNIFERFLITIFSDCVD